MFGSRQESIDSNRPHCPINSLPNELLDTIIQQLSLEDLLHCSQVNTKWFDTVSGKLLRTQSCGLVKDEASCNDFNSNGKAIRQLILRNVDLWNHLRVEKLASLESFYLACDGTCVSLENLKIMLRQCLNLTKLTLHTDSPLGISYLEELLCDLKQVKSVCLLIGEIDKHHRKELLEFFGDCYYFYDEIVIQILNPRSELIYVCSDKVQVNPHVHSNYSEVHFGHVTTGLVENILSNSRTRIKHLEINGEHLAEETLDAICDTHVEHLALKSLFSENEAWKRFFNNVSRDSKELKVLNVSQCSNITNEEIKQLECLHLNRLDIDFSSCRKISVLKQFFNYCLSHVNQLKVCFDYDKNILNNFLSVFEKYSTQKTAVTKQIDVDILRVNHCSEDVSTHIAEFKLSLRKFASQCSIHVNVAEIFTCIRQNV